MHDEAIEVFYNGNSLNLALLVHTWKTGRVPYSEIVYEARAYFDGEVHL